jgi:hypothetical protein
MLDTKLYVREIESGNIKKPKTIKTFLKFYFTYNNNHQLYSSSLATYSNKECTTTHCNRDKLRSFDDMYMITKTYYPSITVEKFITILVNLTIIKNNRLLIPQFDNCGTMMRIRIIYYQNSNNYNDVISKPKYNSEYSWKELFKMIDLTEEKYNKIKQQNEKKQQEYNQKQQNKQKKS